MNRKTIIATLGPSSLEEKIVKKMDLLGVDIFRINLSHVDIDEFENTIKIVKNWTNKPVCLDSEGAQLRTGDFKGTTLQLKTGSKIRFVDSNMWIDKTTIPLNIKNIKKLLLVGDLLRLDFNSVIVQLIEFDDSGIIARVIKGGKIGKNKGISVDRAINLPRFTNKDISAFKISKKLSLDTFFLSFCSSGEDVCALRDLFDYPINVISKIESNRALKNLVSICKESDEILIDRGDLSRDVTLIKIAFAQSYILNTAKSINTPTYVATNLVESMVENPEPTRAEINDIVNTLKSGADGLVLAAETAIGLYPIECVRVVSNVIKEVNNRPKQIEVKYLSEPPSGNIIFPHGGQLVQQFILKEKELIKKELPIISVNQKIESDIIQITNGTYSPLNRFMNQDELKLVTEKNQLRDGTVWPMPILFQLDGKQSKRIKDSNQIAIKSERTGKIFSLIEVDKIEELNYIDKIANNWFGTNNSDHPGVADFIQSGNLIISGKPFLIESKKPLLLPNYELTPIQTRRLFNLYGWSNIIGYHTRNVPHRGHEYIQRRALEETQADGIFLSPVTGIKKNGDFNTAVIIRCFENLIAEGFYNPFEALIGSFNTYSRYSGPKEAFFTAICRKNYGCNYFIVGRDHTGVGNFYTKDASQNIFDELDLEMNILKFDKVSYCPKRKIITNEFSSDSSYNNLVEISGSRVRDMILQGKNIPQYILRPSLLKELSCMMKNNPDDVFV